ncbi:hypothetical protein [Paraburkholderia silvatlantica]|uniref:hypothetical protein n=1 Tax=Paraburkholderia silvatlantica TaxID=321895 RepID=UPI001FCC1896|nr:hypothetical protein [Paraburkholderia silvatlantica]
MVVFDDDGIRAPVTANWLRQLGHEAWVLTGGIDSGLALPDPRVPGPLALPVIDVGTLARHVATAARPSWICGRARLGSKGMFPAAGG